MPLRDRVQSAMTGASSSNDSQPSRNPNNERSLQGPRARRGRADSSTSIADINRRTSQLAIEGDSASSPGSRFRPRQLAIEGSSASTPTRAPRQNRSLGSTTNPAPGRALAEPTTSTLAIEGSLASTPTRTPPQNRLTSATTNPAPGRAPTEPTASTSPLPLARASRPYRSSGNQETFTLDPPRRRPIRDSPRATRGGSAVPPRAANRGNYSAAPRARRNTEDELAPLAQREIIDVTDVDDSSARDNPRGQTDSSPQPFRFQQSTHASNVRTAGTTPQRNQSSTRMPPSARFNNQEGRSTMSGQARRDIRETVSQRDFSSQPQNAPLEGRSEHVSTTHALDEPTDVPQELYLGVFDLEETDQPAQQPAPNARQGPNQPGNSNRSGNFGGSSMSSHTSRSTRHSTVINHGFRVGHTFGHSFCPPPFYPYSCAYHWHDDWRYPWGGLPWFPRPYVVLPRQTVFTEVSVDYFEQDSPATPNLDTSTGLEVINRYYNGWRDAYTQALSYSEEISVADRARIERNRQRLHSRQDNAIRRLRSGDDAIVQETLNQVRMDRQMAMDMPVTQIRWAPPWIREVWVTEHGEIPY